MSAHRQLAPEDYLDIWRRRKWWIILPALVLAPLGFLVCKVIPARYTSKTLVLVEQQKVPDEYVRSVVTNDINGRLASMQEQIFSRTRLEPIIQRFGLYTDHPLPMEERVDKLRKSVSVSSIQTVPGSRVGISGFYIGVSAGTSILAQQICSEITSMFLSENLRNRERIAQGTTDFLASQLESAKQSLDAQDAKLADFERKYMGRLPAQEQTNFSMLATLNTQLNTVNQSLREDAQQKTYLESMLNDELATWRNAQSPENPGVIEDELKHAQAELQQLQERYQDAHPDVQRKKQEIERLQQKSVLAPAKPNSASTLSTPPEPQQVRQLRTRLAALDQATARSKADSETIQAKIRSYESNINLGPAVQEEYKKITRDYQTALQFYNEILAKRNQSEMATNLERQQQGEQFTILDPPNLPAEPAFPQKSKFTGAGFALGLLIGAGLVLWLEWRNKAIRTERDVTHYLQLPTLVAIPALDIEEVQERTTDAQTAERRGLTDTLANEVR